HTRFSLDWSSDVCSSDLSRDLPGEFRSVSERDQPWEQRERHPGVRRTKGHEADCDGVSRLAFQRRRASIAALADRYSAEIPEPSICEHRESGAGSLPRRPRRLNGIARRRGGRIWRLTHGETRLGPDTSERKSPQHRRVPTANAL